jgi:hypothetical protein
MDTIVITPKEITRDPDSSIDLASFGYYDGLKYAELNGLEQDTSFTNVMKYTHFIVCCGDVMVRVADTDYPDIQRRIL